MRKFNVKYREVGSDRIRTTSHTGNLDKEGVIEFFGLNDCSCRRIEYLGFTA